MVDLSQKHFGTMIGGRIYDIEGDSSDKYQWVPWLGVQDNALREKIIEEYIMF